MKTTASHLFHALLILASVLSVSSISSCSLTTDLKKQESYKLTRVFPADAKSSVTFDESIIASPLLYLSDDQPIIIVPVSNGDIAALDSKTGALVWKTHAPAPEGQESQIIATPVMIGNKLVVIYQCLEKGVRISHRLGVIDLRLKKWDGRFPTLVFSAEKPASDGMSTVKFNPPTAFAHSALKHAPKPGTTLGRVYASFGNAGDTQPFHGWMFEIDMEAWLKQGAKQAISNILLTTPEAKCPITMEYGTQEMICGGGIWTPGGPQLYPTADSFEIFVPTGNGQVDLARHDYANTLMRVQPDLKFEDGCDKQLCKNFNPKQPDRACIASCKNLFIPRPPADNLALIPSNRECDDKTFGECLAWMDYDLGASSPVKVTLKSGHSVLVQAGKEGAIYLIDANHLGIQYDRLQIVDVCGTPVDPCIASWMGMIVTQPAIAYIDDEPIIVIPTFMPDKTHPAGIFALKVILENGSPKLKRIWQFPDPASSKAVLGFRSHPSFPVISTEGINKEPIVWVVDIGANGILYGIRIKDGALIANQPLLGAGRQLSAPLVNGNTVYLASIIPSTGKALIEAYRISSEP
jgi:hypothetical protein